MGKISKQVFHDTIFQKFIYFHKINLVFSKNLNFVSMTPYIFTSQKNTSVYYYYNFMWIDTFFIKPKLEGLIVQA